MEAVIVDDYGVPWTPERFALEPQSAQAFLEQYENNSYGMIHDWRDWMHDKIIVEAVQKLRQLQADLISAEFLKSKGAIH